MFYSSQVVQDWTAISSMSVCSIGPRWFGLFYFDPRLPNQDFASLAFEKGRAVVVDPVKKQLYYIYIIH